MNPADEMIAVIEDMLTTLAVADRGDWNVPDMRFYDGALINLGAAFDYAGDRFSEAYGTGKSAFETALNSHKDVRGAIIFGMLGRTRYEITGARELNFRERQRAAPLLSAYIPKPLSALKDRIVECRSIDVGDDAKATTVERNHYYHQDGKWYPAKHEKILPGENFSMGGMGFAMAAIASAVTRISWSVRIRLAPSFPSVGLFTDPPGVREFFKLRDVPEGASRRRALLHWVSQHWRQTRKDPDSEAYVREHLRGDRSFAWGGMTGEILVPESDHNKIESGIAKRKELAVQGLSRRLKF